MQKQSALRVCLSLSGHNWMKKISWETDKNYRYTAWLYDLVVSINGFMRLDLVWLRRLLVRKLIGNGFSADLRALLGLVHPLGHNFLTRGLRGSTEATRGCVKGGTNGEKLSFKTLFKDSVSFGHSHYIKLYFVFFKPMRPLLTKWRIYDPHNFAKICPNVHLISHMWPKLTTK